jgi:hypothetical protein
MLVINLLHALLPEVQFIVPQSHYLSAASNLHWVILGSSRIPLDNIPNSAVPDGKMQRLVFKSMLKLLANMYHLLKFESYVRL